MSTTATLIEPVVAVAVLGALAALLDAVRRAIPAPRPVPVPVRSRPERRR